MKVDFRHTQECGWWKDWHNCKCGYIKTLHLPMNCVSYLESSVLCPECDPNGCRGTIPGTVIACGEEGNYCCQQCLEKANENNIL
jgi:hypothetical protein